MHSLKSLCNGYKKKAIAIKSKQIIKTQKNIRETHKRVSCSKVPYHTSESSVAVNYPHSHNTLIWHRLETITLIHNPNSLTITLSPPVLLLFLEMLRSLWHISVFSAGPIYYPSVVRSTVQGWELGISKSSKKLCSSIRGSGKSVIKSS